MKPETFFQITFSPGTQLFFITIVLVAAFHLAFQGYSYFPLQIPFFHSVLSQQNFSSSRTEMMDKPVSAWLQAACKTRLKPLILYLPLQCKHISELSFDFLCCASFLQRIQRIGAENLPLEILVFLSHEIKFLEFPEKR